MGRHGEQLCRACDGCGVEPLLFPTVPAPACPVCQGLGRVSQTVARGMRWKIETPAQNANRPEGKTVAFCSPQLGLFVVSNPMLRTEKKSGSSAVGAASRTLKVGA